jgi:sugar (pentulose or hexulose) kinase
MNALTWMDSRGAPYVKKVVGGFPAVEGYSLAKLNQWSKKPGGIPMLSGKDDIAHMLLVKHEHPDIYEKTYKFLPSKDYFNLRLTGEFAASYDSIMEDIPALVENKNTYEPKPQNREIYDQLYGDFLSIYKNNKKMFAKLNAVTDSA